MKRAVFWEGELGPACVGKQEHRAPVLRQQIWQALGGCDAVDVAAHDRDRSLRSSFDIGSRELKLHELDRTNNLVVTIGWLALETGQAQAPSVRRVGEPASAKLALDGNPIQHLATGRARGGDHLASGLAIQEVLADFLQPAGGGPLVLFRVRQPIRRVLVTAGVGLASLGLPLIFCRRATSFGKFHFAPSFTTIVG